MSDTTYGIAEFKATDWSSPTRKNTVDDHGGMQVGYNYQDGEYGEVLFVVNNTRTNTDSMIVLDKAEATKMLNHLNDLLGNPLSHPATAGGFAPSAD